MNLPDLQVWTTVLAEAMVRTSPRSAGQPVRYLLRVPLSLERVSDEALPVAARIGSPGQSRVFRRSEEDVWFSELLRAGAFIPEAELAKQLEGDWWQSDDYPFRSPAEAKGPLVADLDGADVVSDGHEAATVHALRVADGLRVCEGIIWRRCPAPRLVVDVTLKEPRRACLCVSDGLEDAQAPVGRDRLRLSFDLHATAVASEVAGRLDPHFKFDVPALDLCGRPASDFAGSVRTEEVRGCLELADSFSGFGQLPAEALAALADLADPASPDDLRSEALDSLIDQLRRETTSNWFARQLLPALEVLSVRRDVVRASPDADAAFLLPL